MNQGSAGPDVADFTVPCSRGDDPLLPGSLRSGETQFGQAAAPKRPHLTRMWLVFVKQLIEKTTGVSTDPISDEALDQAGAGTIPVPPSKSPLPPIGQKAKKTITRCVKIGEAKIHLLMPLAEVEAGEDLVICRDATLVAQMTRITVEDEYVTLSPAIHRGWGKAEGGDALRSIVLAP